MKQRRYHRDKGARRRSVEAKQKFAKIARAFVYKPMQTMYTAVSRSCLCHSICIVIGVHGERFSIFWTAVVVRVLVDAGELTSSYIGYMVSSFPISLCDSQQKRLQERMHRGSCVTVHRNAPSYPLLHAQRAPRCQCHTTSPLPSHCASARECSDDIRYLAQHWFRVGLRRFQGSVGFGKD